MWTAWTLAADTKHIHKHTDNSVQLFHSCRTNSLRLLFVSVVCSPSLTSVYLSAIFVFQIFAHQLWHWCRCGQPFLFLFGVLTGGHWRFMRTCKTCFQYSSARCNVFGFFFISKIENGDPYFRPPNGTSGPNENIDYTSAHDMVCIAQNNLPILHFLYIFSYHILAPTSYILHQCVISGASKVKTVCYNIIKETANDANVDVVSAFC